MTSTADLTNRVMVAVQAAYPQSRLWKMKQGGGYPAASIKAVMGLMLGGKWAEALALLRRSPVLQFGGIGGIPDLDGILPINGYGVRLGIEIKFGADRQSDEQKICQRIYEQTGAIYVIARDVDGCLKDLQKAVDFLRPRA